MERKENLKSKLQCSLFGQNGFEGKIQFNPKQLSDVTLVLLEWHALTETSEDSWLRSSPTD